MSSPACAEATVLRVPHTQSDSTKPRKPHSSLRISRSSVRFSAQQMVVGRAPQALAGYLRFLGDGRKYSLEYEDVLWNNIANGRSPGGAAGVALEFTAKSWLLTPDPAGIDNYTKLFNDPRFLIALRNTAFYTIVSVPLGMLLSLGLALALNQAISGISWIRTMYFLPIGGAVRPLA